MIIEPLAFAFSICLKLLTNKSSILVWKEQWTPVWHELFMRDHIVSFLSGVLGLDGEKCTVPTKQCSPDWRRPPQPLLPWAWEQAGTFVHPFHHAVGRGQTRAISCLFQLAPIAYHVTFGWLAHICVASYWLVLSRETLQDNISHKYQNFCAFNRCLSFA